jgi:hypothetical protein
MVKGKRVLQNLFAPAAGAGLGSFLGASQQSRAYPLDMVKYTAATRPPKDFYAETEYPDLDMAYAYLRHWSSEVKLDLKPPIPEDLLGRHADNLRGLLAVANASGPEWHQQLCDAIRFLYVRERAERPDILILRHGIVIFERLGVEQIEYKQFNRELRQLDLPDARWTRYRGPAGFDLAHPIEFNEQGKLLQKSGIETKQLWTPGPRTDAKKFRGYTFGQFREALRASGNESAVRLRLVPPSTVSDE